MNFDAKERALIGALADVLIPTGEGMPSGSAADVAGRGLDEVLRCRPELFDPLKRLLASVSGREPRQFLDELKRHDPHPDYLDDGLLQSVIDRGPIYRPTPK